MITTARSRLPAVTYPGNCAASAAGSRPAVSYSHPLRSSQPPSRRGGRGRLSADWPPSEACREAVPTPIRGETVGAVRALRRDPQSFSLGNAQPGAPRTPSRPLHSRSSRSAIGVERRASNRTASVSARRIQHCISPSFSFAAKTTARPKVSVRTARMFIR